MIATQSLIIQKKRDVAGVTLKPALASGRRFFKLHPCIAVGAEFCTLGLWFFIGLFFKSSNSRGHFKKAHDPCSYLYSAGKHSSWNTTNKNPKYSHFCSSEANVVEAWGELVAPSRPPYSLFPKNLEVTSV